MKRKLAIGLASFGTASAITGLVLGHVAYGNKTDASALYYMACVPAASVEVGSTPAGDGAFGQADLGGNVTEWTLDWYTSYPTPCLDCASLNLGPEQGHAGWELRLPGGMASVRPSRGQRRAAPALRQRRLLMCADAVA